MMLRVPLFGPLTTAKARLTLSTSFALSVTSTDVSSLVPADALFATGGSFTGATVMETVAILESRPPSFILNVKLSAPLKFPFGAYVTVAEQVDPVPLATQFGDESVAEPPFVGPATIMKVKLALSGSLPLRVTTSGVSSAVVTATWLAVGG